MHYLLFLCNPYCLVCSSHVCHLHFVTFNMCYVWQNVRMDHHAAARNDGQGDWLDVQTLYASDRYTQQHRNIPPVFREYLFFFKHSDN